MKVSRLLKIRMKGIQYPNANCCNPVLLSVRPHPSSVRGNQINRATAGCTPLKKQNKTGPSHPTGGNALLSLPGRGAVSSTAPPGVTEATRRSPERRCLTARRRRSWSASPLLASADVEAGADTQVSSDGDDGGSSGFTSAASGEMRRVYDTWRWRGHNINFRVEGVQSVRVCLCLCVIGDFRGVHCLFQNTTGLKKVGEEDLRACIGNVELCDEPIDCRT